MLTLLTDFVRLRHSFPSYIDVSGLLIDIVSVMGKQIWVCIEL